MNGAIWTMESLLWGHRGGSSPALTRHLACFPISISPSLVTRWMQTNMDSYQNLEEEKKKKKAREHQGICRNGKAPSWGFLPSQSLV